MKDYLHSILTWVDHNRWLFVGLLLAVVSSVWLMGCEVKTLSLIRPGEKVTAAAFETEAIDGSAELEYASEDLEANIKKHNRKVATFNAKIERGRADIQHQIEVREEISSTISGLVGSAVQGKIDPLQAVASIGTLAALLGLGGAWRDNRRKDKLLKKKGNGGT